MYPPPPPLFMTPLFPIFPHLMNDTPVFLFPPPPSSSLCPPPPPHTYIPTNTPTYFSIYDTSVYKIIRLWLSVASELLNWVCTVCMHNIPKWISCLKKRLLMIGPLILYMAAASQQLSTVITYTIMHDLPVIGCLILYLQNFNYE